ncbi:type II toxin-antitoxin system VapC family toxin [Methylopila sp. Yamaguchi]|uniref:type II toxin-antitoxin system VapC family toxin n=1 Tax=Methylopila sp. Yamaguchi TaxID=1437817 RepID=UPI001FCE3C05|nr:type II toxin-antitoxin system VapC family toxin [Methylopila sp. Yamaguchi]
MDSSALVAIAKNESEGEAFAQVIGVAEALVGAPTLLETRIVLQSLMSDGADRFIDDIASNPAVTVVAFTADHYRLAAEAFQRYGRGRGHPAKLNFGDCMSYAIAKFHNAPLLFKGDDFVHTDIEPAYRP